MRSWKWIGPAVLALALFGSVGCGSDDDEEVVRATEALGYTPAFCRTELEAASEQPGTAIVRNIGKRLIVRLRGTNPRTLYTVWIDFRNRANNNALPPGHPEGSMAVAPAFASTDGATNGVGPDPNYIYTNRRGNGRLIIDLDYDLLRKNDTPVVGAMLSMQGMNRVGGYWLRSYPKDPATEASLQVADPNDPFMPVLRRSTAQGITIVRHPDFITHGHTPGVGGVDHFSAFKGDFAEHCPRLEAH